MDFGSSESSLAQGATLSVGSCRCQFLALVGPSIWSTDALGNAACMARAENMQTQDLCT